MHSFVVTIITALSIQFQPANLTRIDSVMRMSRMKVKTFGAKCTGPDSYVDRYNHVTQVAGGCDISQNLVCSTEGFCGCPTRLVWDDRFFEDIHDHGKCIRGYGGGRISGAPSFRTWTTSFNFGPFALTFATVLYVFGFPAICFSGD